MQKIAIASVVCTCLLSSCIKYINLVGIQNNSNKNIYYTYSNLYPDTSVDHSVYIPAGSMRTPSEIIAPGQSFPIIKTSGGMSLDTYFANNVPSDTLEIFIYDVNVVRSTPWDSVIAKYLVLKRYDLTADSLKKLHGVIVYP